MYKSLHILYTFENKAYSFINVFTSHIQHIVSLRESYRACSPTARSKRGRRRGGSLSQSPHSPSVATARWTKGTLGGRWSERNKRSASEVAVLQRSHTTRSRRSNGRILAPEALWFLPCTRCGKTKMKNCAKLGCWWPRTLIWAFWWQPTHLDAVGRAVEKADTAHAVQDGVAAVLQHVVGADGGLTLSLSGKDGALHDGEVILVQHFGHVRQLSAEDWEKKKYGKQFKQFF